MRANVVAVVFTLVVAVDFAIASEDPDIAALRALDQAYATEWIKGDADGVLALFTVDATLVPHHGDAPVKGKEAIRDFWFNPEYPPTIIPEWRRQPSEFFVSGDIGVVRGRARLVWEYSGTRTTIPDGNYVMIATRVNEAWLIRMLTWNDDPRKWQRDSID